MILEQGVGSKGFPNSSVGKESTCNARDPSLFPGLGRSTGEGKGYLLQYAWASLVAQLVKNQPAKRETGFNPWIGKIPWRRERLPTPVFWPWEFKSRGLSMLPALNTTKAVGKTPTPPHPSTPPLDTALSSPHIRNRLTPPPVSKSAREPVVCSLHCCSRDPNNALPRWEISASRYWGLDRGVTHFNMITSLSEAALLTPVCSETGTRSLPQLFSEKCHCGPATLCKGLDISCLLAAARTSSQVSRTKQIKSKRVSALKLLEPEPCQLQPPLCGHSGAARCGALWRPSARQAGGWHWGPRGPWLCLRAVSESSRQGPNPPKMTWGDQRVMNQWGQLVRPMKLGKSNRETQHRQSRPHTWGLEAPLTWVLRRARRALASPAPGVHTHTLEHHTQQLWASSLWKQQHLILGPWQGPSRRRKSSPHPWACAQCSQRGLRECRGFLNAALTDTKALSTSSCKRGAPGLPQGRRLWQRLALRATGASSRNTEFWPHLQPSLVTLDSLSSPLVFSSWSQPRYSSYFQATLLLDLCSDRAEGKTPEWSGAGVVKAGSGVAGVEGYWRVLSP